MDFVLLPVLLSEQKFLLCWRSCGRNAVEQRGWEDRMMKRKGREDGQGGGLEGSTMPTGQVKWVGTANDCKF